MSYVEAVLAPGERVKYTGRLHWIIYGRGFAALGLELAFVVAEIVWPDLGQFANRWAIICLAAAAIAFLKAWIQQATTEIAATDRRIIFKTGLIQRRTVEMHLDKVESVDIRQSVLGRMFDYGTVIVRGTGAGIEPLSNVAEPLKLRSFVVTD